MYWETRGELDERTYEEDWDQSIERPIAPREPPQLDEYHDLVGKLWRRRIRNYVARGKEWIERRMTRGADGKAEEHEVTVYIPILDPERVESALRLARVPESDRPSMMETFEFLHYASRRDWTTAEVEALERRCGIERRSTREAKARPLRHWSRR